jgi:hypothetical protein
MRHYITVYFYVSYVYYVSEKPPINEELTEVQPKDLKIENVYIAERRNRNGTIEQERALVMGREFNNNDSEIDCIFYNPDNNSYM